MYIVSSVTSIGDYAFNGCHKLVEVYNLSSLYITPGSGGNGNVGNYALNVYTPTSGESKLSTNNNGYVFYEDGDTVYLIEYTGSSTKLTLPESFNGKNYDIYQYAFYGNTSITSVTIGDGVNSIGNYAFQDCKLLTSVTIGNNVTSIGEWAFENCTSLTSITIPDSVTSIGEYAFFFCSSLKSVTIGDGVTSIGSSAFRYCTSLESITIPDTVTSIESGAFYNCSSLKSITIGNGVTSIGDVAFYNCSSLNTVYYNGTAEDWSSFSIGSSNTNLTDATRYYYSESKPEEEGNYWHYVDGEIVIWTKE